MEKFWLVILVLLSWLMIRRKGAASPKKQTAPPDGLPIFYTEKDKKNASEYAVFYDIKTFKVNTDTAYNEKIISSGKSNNSAPATPPPPAVPEMEYIPSAAGLLYNKNVLNLEKEICPPGSQFPTNDDIKDLITYFDENSIAPTTANLAATGFNLQNGGQRDNDGSFLDYTEDTHEASYIWSGTINWDKLFQPIYNFLSMPDGANINLASDINTNKGLSIRCVLGPETPYYENMFLTDADGNKYGVKRIGFKYWLTANLITTKFNDGTPIANLTADLDWIDAKTPAYVAPNNDPNLIGTNVETPL